MDPVATGAGKQARRAAGTAPGGVATPAPPPAPRALAHDQITFVENQAGGALVENGVVVVVAGTARILPPPTATPEPPTAAIDHDIDMREQQAARRGAAQATVAARGARQASATGKEATLLHDYSTYTHGGLVRFVFANRGQGLRCACGARFNAKTGLPRLENSLKNHCTYCSLQPTFENDTLHPFLMQISMAANANHFAEVPIDFQQAIGRQLQPRLSARLISWCTGCGKTFGSSNSVTCACPVQRRVRIWGLVGSTATRVTPIGTHLPIAPDEHQLALSVLLPGQDLHTQVVKLQGEKATLKNQLFNSAARTATPASGVDVVIGNTEKFAQDLEYALANPQGKLSTSREYYYLKRVRLHNVNEAELAALFALVRRPLSAIENEIKLASDNLSITANNKLGEATQAAKQSLYRVFGEEENYGVVDQVVEPSRVRYELSAGVKLAIGLYRSETKLGKDFNQAIRTAAALTYDSSRARAAELARIVNMYMHIAYVMPSSQSRVDEGLRILSACLIRRQGSRDDKEEYEETGDAPGEALEVVAQERASVIFAAARYKMMCILAVCKDQQTQYSNHLDFVDKHRISEFPRQVNAHIAFCRQAGAQKKEDSDTVFILAKPGGTVFIANHTELGVESFARASIQVRVMMARVMTRYKSSALQQVMEFMKGQFQEHCFQMDEVNNKWKFIGEGWVLFQELTEAAIDSCSAEEFKDWHEELLVLVSTLLSVESSVLARWAALSMLFADPTRARDAPIRVCKNLRPGKSGIKIHGSSPKHRNEADIYGYAEGSLGKLIAFVHVQTVQIYASKVVSKYLQGATRLTDSHCKHFMDKLTRMAASHDYYLQLILPADELRPASEMTMEDLQQVFLARSSQAFAQAVVGVARIAFGCEGLTQTSFRRLMSTFNQYVPDLVGEQLQRTDLPPDNMMNLAIVHKSMVCVTEKPKGLGDGGAHSGQTQQKVYMGRQQGATVDVETFTASYLLGSAKFLLVRNLHGQDGESSLAVERLPLQQFTSNEMQNMIQDMETKAGLMLNGWQRGFIEHTLCRNDIMVLAPPGSGKTTIQILVAGSLRGVTLLLTPTKSLAQSVQLDCVKHGVGSIIYTNADGSIPSAFAWRSDSATKLVVVVFDTAVMEAFRAWVFSMNQHGLINRVMIDEVHSLIDSGDYRAVMSRVKDLRAWLPGVPFTIASGTMNRPMMDHFKHVFDMQGCKEIELCISFRKWSGFDLHWVDCNISSHFTAYSLDSIAHTLRSTQTRHTALVFMTSVANVELAQRVLSKALPNTTIKTAHAKLSEHANGEAIKLLMESQTGNALVLATSYLGQGMNFVGVSHVFCVGAYSAMGMVQQLSRAGRGPGIGGRVAFFYWPKQAPFDNKEPHAYLDNNNNLDKDSFSDVLTNASLNKFAQAVDSGSCAIRYLEGLFGNKDGDDCNMCGPCCGVAIDHVKAYNYATKDYRLMLRQVGDFDHSSFGNEIIMSAPDLQSSQAHELPPAAVAAAAPDKPSPYLAQAGGTNTAVQQRFYSNKPLPQLSQDLKRTFPTSLGCAARGAVVGNTGAGIKMAKFTLTESQNDLLGERASIDVEFEAYTAFKARLERSGRDYCMLCDQELRGTNHFPNTCSGLNKWLDGSKCCNYCFKTDHWRKGSATIAGCCDYRLASTCQCFREDCDRTTFPSFCGSFWTFRSVLVWFWQGNRALLSEFFPQTLAFECYGDLFTWATTQRCLEKPGTRPRKNLVQVLGRFLMLKAEKRGDYSTQTS